MKGREGKESAPLDLNPGDATDEPPTIWRKFTPMALRQQPVRCCLWSPLSVSMFVTLFASNITENGYS